MHKSQMLGKSEEEGGVKAWSVSAFFPEVRPAHQAQQSATVEASDLPCAARRGLEQILGLPVISGKHISVVKLTVVAASKKAVRSGE